MPNPTLLSIGPVNFEVEPLSLMAIDDTARTAFARKDVVGGDIAYEHTGGGETRRQIRARVFPEKFGGLNSLEALDEIRRSGVAQMMVRGDGKVLDYWLIEEVSQASSYIDAEGIGRMIEVDITLVKAGQPDAATAFSQLFSLFA